MRVKSVGRRHYKLNVFTFHDVPREVEPIREGKEPKEFWEAIGGKEEYATGKRIEVTC